MANLTINGKTFDLDVEPDTPLLWAIRENAGLTGTKYGCGIARCGACTVVMTTDEGRDVAIRSCVTPVERVRIQHNRNVRITTIEGLGTEDRLHAVQDAWLKANVPQCGYCQSGQIMSAAALLAQKPNPTNKDIDDAMAANICRCGTYQRIRAAIHRAAATMRGPAAGGRR